jgi:hypothetical protein
MGEEEREGKENQRTEEYEMWKKEKNRKREGEK